MTVEVADGGQSISGSIDLGGSSGSGGPQVSSHLTARFEGTLTGQGG
jgi:hypothetical protein